MEYTIIRSFGSEGVIKAVNEHLKEGWVLYGDLCTSAALRGDAIMVSYAQAMTREDSGVGVLAQGIAEQQS